MSPSRHHGTVTDNVLPPATMKPSEVKIDFTWVVEISTPKYWVTSATDREIRRSFVLNGVVASIIFDANSPPAMVCASSIARNIANSGPTGDNFFSNKFD